MTTTPSIATRTLYWLRGRRSLRAEIKALREAAQALSDRLEVVHNDDSYRAVWSLSHAHCGGYTGPRYDTELAELRRALTDTGETGA
jgi:hypothetical protein